MNEELTTFIIRELSKNHNRQNIIRRVSESTGLTWKQAEQLTILVEAKHKRSVTVQQAPVLLFISIGILILGISLLGFNLQILLAFFQNDILSQILSVQSSAYRTIGLLTGFGMSIGGLIGLWKSFEKIFPE